jgi:hypothetical protein
VLKDLGPDKDLDVRIILEPGYRLGAPVCAVLPLQTDVSNTCGGQLPINVGKIFETLCVEHNLAPELCLVDRGGGRGYEQRRGPIAAPSGSVLLLAVACQVMADEASLAVVAVLSMGERHKHRLGLLPDA